MGRARQARSSLAAGGVESVIMNPSRMPWAVLTVALLVVAPPAFAGRKNVEAIGSLSCGGQPLDNATVELVEYRWPGWSDPVIDRGLTDAAGRFSLRGTGGWVFGDPTTYVRVLYESRVPPPPDKGTRVHDEIGRTRVGIGPRFDFRFGVLDMGALNSNGLDCLLWDGLGRAVEDYRATADPVAPLPYDDVAIQRWSAASAGTPFALLSTISWPTGYRGSGVRSEITVFHEFAHTVRHSFDGDFGHFLGDVVSFNYLRNHNTCDVTNEGFAFNEGWAEFWETRSSPLPRGRAFCNTPPRWDVEGDVAADLRQWSRCVGYENMARILRDNPSAIHSRDEFVAALRARFPRACVPPDPPAPSDPGACASGGITQQFYGDVVGCAGNRQQAAAGALCGTSHRLCTGSEWVTARRGLITPTHDYWVSDTLNFLNVGGGFCSANSTGGTPCGAASMHVCTASGMDGEGNTCLRRNCAFETKSGTEFPPNEFFGGCGAGNDTAGAVCCPRTVRVGAGAFDTGTPDPAAARRLRGEARARLQSLIANLERELEAAQGAARWPASCAGDESCGAALQAVAQPALLAGTLSWRRAQLELFDANPESPEALQAIVSAGGLERWRTEHQQAYVTRVAGALAQAARAAIKLLEEGRARPAFATYVHEAVRHLEQQAGRLEAGQRQPDGWPPELGPFDAEADTSSFVTLGKR